MFDIAPAQSALPTPNHTYLGSDATQLVMRAALADLSESDFVELERDLECYALMGVMSSRIERLIGADHPVARQAA